MTSPAPNNAAWAESAGLSDSVRLSHRIGPPYRTYVRSARKRAQPMSALDNRTGRHRHRAEPAAVPSHPPDQGRRRGHGHGHGPAHPASRRVRLLVVVALVPIALATLIGLWLTWP